ncbi:MAG: hypothetical protein OXC79_07310 [Candidatus Poribacteria bacterium]|nr:hypothetical protein [Candidatus Poribacteria bacterium]
MIETSVIVALLAAGVPVLLGIVGGIIWIVREFGKVNARLSLLERSVKRLEDFSIYQTPVKTDQIEKIEGFEIRILTKNPDV